MSRTLTVAGAAVLLAVSIAGITHGARAVCAYAIYHQARYMSGNPDPFRSLKTSERAHRLYPFDYNICIWAGETAYYNLIGPDGKELRDRVEAAGLWCERGLRLDPYKSQLRRLKANLMERESLPAAIRYWEEFVEWQYWAPYNHLALVDMYARAGDFDKALKSLKLIEGTEYHAEGRKRLLEAWRKEQQWPVTEPSGKPSGRPQQ